MGAVLLRPRPRFSPDCTIPYRRGEALIRVKLAGICSTDLQILQGYMGFIGILGHEFVGEVVRAADRDWIGRRVVGEINVGCGRCTLCRSGRRNHCPDRTVLGILNRQGSFADYLTLPLANLHPVPEAVPDEAAVFTEPLAAAFRILEQLTRRPEEEVLLVGDGKLALLIAQVLKSAGCRLRVAGKHREKRRRLADWGIEAIDVRRLSGRKAIADIVVEATGSRDGLALALQWVRPQGKVVLKSTCSEASRLHLAPLVIDEVTLIGSRCGPFPPALQALAERSVAVHTLISEVFPLKRGVRALRYASEPGVLKVLLAPGR